MPEHNFEPLRGKVTEIVIDSEALRGNLLGDPSRRTVPVHLPPGYDATDADYPLFVSLAAFTGSGPKRLNWKAFGESEPQRIERLVAEGSMGPVVSAYPDSFTSLGGNQFVDTPVLGNWETFLTGELVPRLEERFRVRRGSEHRAVYGRSSGGYGALVQGLRHGESWGALACHSGDVGFDRLYRCDLPKTLDVLARHEGSVERFLASVRSAREIAGSEMHALMILAMAASYDPDESSPPGIRLPVDPYTCELDEDRWSRWLAHDPLHLADRPECRESLAKLNAVFLDCGARDDYHLHYGARALVAKLHAAGLDPVYEEFDGGHSGIDHRLDRSLPFLYDAVAPAQK